MTGPVIPSPTELAELRRRVGRRHSTGVTAAAMSAMHGGRTILVYGDDHQAERVARAIRETMPAGISSLITVRGPAVTHSGCGAMLIITDEVRQTKGKA